MYFYFCETYCYLIQKEGTGLPNEHFKINTLIYLYSTCSIIGYKQEGCGFVSQ
jgi:hypothetical protein